MRVPFLSVSRPCPAASACLSYHGLDVVELCSLDIEPTRAPQTTQPNHTHARNYTITLSYTSSINSDRPRNNLIANETEEARLPDSRGYYPYSGQSFNGCSYTSCPIEAGVPQVYTYEFVTLKSVSQVYSLG